MKTEIRNTLVNANQDCLLGAAAVSVSAEAAARALEDMAARSEEFRGLRLLAADLRDAASHAHKRAWEATLAVISATNDDGVK